MHNVFSIDDLWARGLNATQIRGLVSAGSLIRLRRGWYATRDAPPEVTAALKAGAHLGCLSGCAIHGLWVPPFTGVHAAYGRGITPRKSGPQLHHYKARQPVTPVWPVEDCLAQVIERHDVETSLIVVESAMDKKLLTRDVAESMLRKTPHGDLRQHLGAARSGSETRVRLFFQARNVEVRPLVYIPTIGEVDMLVGQRLITECDSQRYHSTPEAQDNDCRRDLNATLLGYSRVRLTYNQVWKTWSVTQQNLSALLKKQRHIHRIRESQATTDAGRARAKVLAQQHEQRRRIHAVGLDDDLRDIL